MFRAGGGIKYYNMKNIRAIVYNIHKKGISGTLETYAKRKSKKEKEKSKEKCYECLYQMYRNRKYARKGTDSVQYRRAMQQAQEYEQTLKRLDHKLYSKYRKEMIEYYLLELYPKVYGSMISVPVKNKVVFMEKGKPVSPPNSYFSSVLKKQGKYEVVMMGMGKHEVSELEIYENGLKLIREISDAKAVFISSANSLFCGFDFRPETKLIQLWHGLGIIKKVGYSTIDSKGFGMSEAEREKYDQYRNYSYVTLPSMEQAWIFEESMHIPVESGKLVPVGVARTDVFYHPKYINSCRAKLMNAYPQIGKRKIILYAPTYRGRLNSAVAPEALDINLLGEMFSEEYVLLIKHHGATKKDISIPEKWKDSFAFDIKKSKVLSIDKMLAIADICITDYSSVAFEYSIMEKPMIFFAFDLDEYIDSRGMYYKYEDITPGPICRTNEELADKIRSVDEWFDLQGIRDFKEKFVGACDGHSAERTIELIEK